ncbi:MAG: late competence development ComFB family protein [Dethiobacteria bacterium]|jgi:competence protein ComFB
MPILQNLMEEIVFRTIDDLAPAEKVCTCERCRMDIAALALNKLPPRYAVSAKGASYTRADFLEIQKYVDVIGAVTQAIKLVQKHPQHQITE